MLNVGVIGVGSISSAHLKAYTSHTEVMVTALCDINEQRLKEKGEMYRISNLYSDYRQLLADPAIDAVSVCTWNDTHAEIAIAALKAGKHVLVEKPLSMSVEEAERVKQAADRTDKIMQVGFVRRFSTNAKVLKEYIDQDDLGSIYYAKASCLRRLGNPGGWFSDRKRSGGGPLIDLGVHVIDLCWYLMGKPNPVSITGNTYSRLGNRSGIQHLSFYKAADYNAEFNNVEDLTNALIKFENGASLYIDVSFTLHSKEDKLAIELYGEKGGAEVEPGLTIMSEKNNSIINIIPQLDYPSFNFGEAFGNEISHFVNCCLTGEATIAPAEDGLQVMRMIQGIYQSAKTGREIIFSEEGAE